MARIRHFCGKLSSMLGGAGLAVVLASALLHPAPAQADDEARENVTLSGSHSDVQFLAGRSVLVTAEVSDDVFAAGRYVTFDAANVLNAIVAGYAVEQRGGTMADMIAAGSSVTVAGTITDDIVAASRSMRLASTGSVGGDARLAAETVDIEGRIGGSLRAAARQITISGTIDGKVDLFAERIVILSGAKIAGDLIYRGENAPEIGEGATIGGEVRHVEVSLPDTAKLGLAILGIGIAIAIGWAVAILVLVTLIRVAFPDITTSTSEALRERPWASLGIGVASVLIASALMGLAFFSIFAIPLGMALLMAIGTIKLFGLTAVSACIGQFISRRRSTAPAVQPGIGWTLVGALILLFVFIIPVIGVIVASLAVIAGMGAAAIELWQRLRSF